MANMGGYILAEVMLWLMYAMLFVALVAAVASAVHSLRHRYDSIAASNRVPRKYIAWGVAGFTVLLLLITCLAGSSQPLIINGITYTDRFWLKATDGLIVSSVILMVIAACFVIYGMSGINRKLKH
ncbi:MAG: hypothetical protein IJ069_03725 [Prevotella sp.]|nr:hypothetical protein [Prevotella sp.]MBQ8152772.1 hypothetical protein [Prevotella sp.]MBQ8714815.1 hypothetical protein [Prevotella sp.]